MKRTRHIGYTAMKMIKFMEISDKMCPAAIKKCFLTIKVNVGNNQEMAQSERNSNSKNRCGKN